VVIAYSLSPIDLIPDFIPILGYLDDLILVPLGILLAIKLVPKEIFEDARRKVAVNPEETGISGWWFAAVIIIFWVCVIGLVIKAIGLDGKDLRQYFGTNSADHPYNM
jgi:hypothetical protein